jgi:hypothetical protein
MRLENLALYGIAEIAFQQLYTVHMLAGDYVAIITKCGLESQPISIMLLM